MISPYFLLQEIFKMFNDNVIALRLQGKFGVNMFYNPSLGSNRLFQRLHLKNKATIFFPFFDSTSPAAQHLLRRCVSFVRSTPSAERK